jgi:hypothetical protein
MNSLYGARMEATKFRAGSVGEIFSALKDEDGKGEPSAKRFGIEPQNPGGQLLVAQCHAHILCLDVGEAAPVAIWHPRAHRSTATSTKFPQTPG